jgi:hypothetical protein
MILRVDKDHLVLEGVGPSTPLTSVSDTEFSVSGMTLKFDPTDTKTVTIKIVEGDLKAIRK